MSENWYYNSKSITYGDQNMIALYLEQKILIY